MGSGIPYPSVKNFLYVWEKTMQLLFSNYLLEIFEIYIVLCNNALFLSLDEPLSFVYTITFELYLNIWTGVPLKANYGLPAINMFVYL